MATTTNGFIRISAAARIWLFVFALACGAQAWATSALESRFLGTVDSTAYTDQSRQIEIRGWTVEAEQGSKPARIEASINGETVQLALVPAHRPDVQHTHHTRTAEVGFIGSAVLSNPLSGGLHEVHVTAVFPDGHRLALHDWGGGTPQLHVTKARLRHWIVLGCIILSIALAYVPAARRLGTRMGQWIALRRRRLAWGIVASFMMLVAFGFTGSSLALLTGGDYGRAVMEVAGNKSRLFGLRSIRADEWGVLTPNALAQVKHTPPFPIVNSKLGLEGQNMGVIGMTGAPIAQPAAVARPATWGYFLLPLRQALSWQWQLPFFACLLGFWAFLNVLRPQQTALNLTLALSFCVAPYAAAWSNWPLYATCFPIIALLVLHHVLKATQLKQTIPLGLALGLLIASWVLVLYPPWQITVGSFCALLGLGIWLDRKHELRFGRAQWVSIGLALLIVVSILSSWWIDTRDAVSQIRSTVYPGSRNALQGGEIGHLWALRGYMNAETLTFGTGPDANASEASSYFLLPLVILWLGAWHMVRKRSHRWAIGACVAFISFWLVFRFFGVPLWLAKATLWSNVPSGRLDLSLGLACTVLIALVAPAGREANDAPRGPAHFATALALTGVSVAIIYYGLSAMPATIFPKKSAPFMVAMLLAGAAMSWWLMRGKTTAAIGLGLVLALLSTIGFNPVSRAPRKIELAEPVVQLTSQQASTERTLVIGGGVSAMSLAAVGIPVVNGVLYYPHRTLWAKMDLPADEWPKVNRYQHLAFNLANIPHGRPYRVANGLDHVNVEVDPRRFDFASTGAHRIAALSEEAKHLRDNRQLRELGNHAGVVWFSVRPDTKP